MSVCEQQMCRGGMSCCRVDPAQGPYCVMESFCSPSPPLWQTIFIPAFLLVATIGIIAVLYCKYRHMKPYLYTMADFVERQVRLQPVDRKFKTIDSQE